MTDKLPDNVENRLQELYKDERPKMTRDKLIKILGEFDYLTTHGIVDAILSACPELGVDDDVIYQYAKSLAEILHEKHFPANTEWSCLDTTLGILTQIDNMTTKWKPTTELGEQK